jgi:transcriptional regulator of acetoin/glycerol metabolism
VRYAWPGNVRELEHVIERAVIVGQHPVITPADLPAAIRGARPSDTSAFVIPPNHTLAEIEKLAILQALERTRWNKRAAATSLGMYRPTFYNKLRKYKLYEPRPRALKNTEPGG